MEVTGERFIPRMMRGDIEIEHFHRYNAIEKLVKNKKVLDAASGTGYGSYILSKFAKEVKGIDISKEAIEYANKNYKNDNLEFKVNSIEKIEFPDNYFDVIVSYETIEHVSEDVQKKFLKEVYRVLNKNGILIMSTPNKKVYSDDRNYKNEYHIKEFYEDEFLEFIKTKFDYVDIYCQYFSNTSILTKYNDVPMNAINFNEKNRGMYFVVIASKRELNNKENINSVYYYSEEDINADDYLQVFYSNDNLFTEKNSIKSYISKKTNKICKKIDMKDMNLKYIRIDPITTSCIIEINKINIKTTSNKENNIINSISTNAEIINGNLYTFLNNDPQIYIQLDDIYTIDSIDVEISIMEKDLNILEYYKKLNNNLNQKNEEINKIKIEKDEEINKCSKEKDEEINKIKIEKDEEINRLNIEKDEEINRLNIEKDEEINRLNIEKDEEINRLNKCLKEKEIYIRNIEDSKSWKMITKIKKLIGK